MSANLLRFVLPLLPISSLSLALQALHAWLNPTDPLSRDFFAVLSHLFVFELVFMHSSIFWLGRRSFLSGKSKTNRKTALKNESPSRKTSKIKEMFFGLFLFCAYGLFILPMIDKNPFLAWNYLILNLLRFVAAEQEPWYAETEFYKKAVNPNARPMMMAVSTMIKLFYFSMALPLFIYALPIPDFGLNREVLKDFPIHQSDPFGLILLTKTMFFYFSSLFIFDLFLRLYKFRKSRLAVY